MEAVSRAVWPYSEAKLVFLVTLMPALDIASTFAALELSGKSIAEAGTIGKWALVRVGTLI